MCIMGKFELYRQERRNGLTVQQIAEKYGVTKQCVSQACCVGNKNKFKGITNQECIYYHLREWMNVNKVKKSALMFRVGLEPLSANYEKFNKILTGKSEPKKGLIDKLIRVTGLPYAMLFWEG